MSSDQTVIKVEGLSKCFNIYEHPRDRLKQMLIPRMQRLTGHEEAKYFREFWALKNVSFEVGKGQTVGVIGQNGSGKSTLLQIITGTLAPTLGTVNTSGRVAALLELGSGFNPEFTGVENVYLNGSLLGLTEAEIDEKFDRIASFADIGDYLNQPVKTYSSGMIIRLAFAVQVVVETEVIIIDEALAVGDARFQLKCFKRLKELKDNGTTILFVSHDVEQVKSFCDAGLVLEKGKAIYWGDAKSATNKYLASIFPDQKQPQNKIEIDDVSASGHAEIELSDKCLIVKPNQNAAHTFGVGGATLEWLKIFGLTPPSILMGGREIRMLCKVFWDIDHVISLIDSDNYQPNIAVGFALANKQGNYIFGCNNYDSGLFIDGRLNGTAIIQLSLVMPFLAADDYFVTISIALGEQSYHTQLRSYDYLLQVRVENHEKKVFGVMGIDYQISLIGCEDKEEIF